MVRPKVNSPSLAHALDTFGGRVENFTETLDAISKDIKSLEGWLQNSGVRVEASVVYYESGHYVDSEDISNSQASQALEYGGSLPVRGDTKKVTWGPGTDGKAWRILHQHLRHTGTFDEGNVSWETTKVLDSRPLIETPAETRMGLGDALAKLIEEMGSKVPAYTQETLIEGDFNAYDSSRPESGTGPWRVRFQTGRNIESTTGQRVYETWTDVLDAVARLTDISPEDLPLNGSSFTLQRLKVPIRVLRELKLM